MESKDIIMALKICSKNPKDDDCVNCAYCNKEDCITLMANNIISLIKNQQAEIEKLKDILDKKVIEFAYEKKQEIKIEAYKEYADRLKKRTVTFSFERGIGKFNGALVDVDDIDKTFNELTERKED